MKGKIILPVNTPKLETKGYVPNIQLPIVQAQITTVVSAQATKNVSDKK
ncbi:MAG: hypothetical protein JST87_00360 [Bacteroidetes bacterium]|nr:hypothetical protein [Bacteroidota bacterium]